MVPKGATEAGSRKMPPPMMLPMTRAVATGRPKRRECPRPAGVPVAASVSRCGVVVAVLIGWCAFAVVRTFRAIVR